LRVLELGSDVGIEDDESEGLSVFFIGLTLTARRRSGVDNANLMTPFCMRNYHETPREALADKEPPLLAD